MATLWDITAQHSGWQGSTFAAGGWQDFALNTTPGVKPGSFWVAPLNGQPTDVAVGKTKNPALGIQHQWFNQHIASPRQVTFIAAEPVLAPDDYLYLYTRVPANNQQILVRFVLSDQPITPPPSDSPCRYGTQPKASSPPSIIATPDLITAILNSVNLLWSAILFVPLHYSPINVSRLCAAPPPPLPELSLESIGGSVVRIQQALDAVSWPYFCECAPGTPAPVPFPPPAQTQPPNWPSSPTFPCDPADLCETLSLLRQELAAARTTIGSIYQLATVTQRYGTPFAYNPGALHMGLTGEGEFAVPRIVGVHARIASAPPSKVLQGNPDYWWAQGWMSLGNEQGMLIEQRVSRPDHIWMPDEAPAATRFRWALMPGVVLDVRELYAEP